MRAADFADILRNCNMLKFGILDRTQTVAKLRELADRIEKDEAPRIALQQAFYCEESKNDDFLLSHLAFQFAELAPTATVGTKLYGSSAAPIEVKEARIMTEDEVADAMKLAAELEQQNKQCVR